MAERLSEGVQEVQLVTNMVVPGLSHVQAQLAFHQGQEGGRRLGPGMVSILARALRAVSPSSSGFSSRTPTITGCQGRPWLSLQGSASGGGKTLGRDSSRLLSSLCKQMT